jgi:hypothetical protein
MNESVTMQSYDEYAKTAIRFAKFNTEFLYKMLNTPIVNISGQASQQSLCYDNCIPEAKTESKISCLKNNPRKNL